MAVDKKSENYYSMDTYTWLTWGITPVQNGHDSKSTFFLHKHGYNFISVADIELKFGVVVAESHLQLIL